MQGEHLDIILYDIGMLLLALQLKVAVSTTLQPSYADDAAV